MADHGIPTIFCKDGEPLVFAISQFIAYHMGCRLYEKEGEVYFCGSMDDKQKLYWLTLNCIFGLCSKEVDHINILTEGYLTALLAMN